MNLKRLFLSTGVMVASLAGVAYAQTGPLYDKVTVNLPYRVTVRDAVLEPGPYVIQQFNSSTTSSRILQIFNGPGPNGRKLQTSVMTIPTLDPQTAQQTRVILHHYGNDYYFDKIWIAGKQYGYEFPLPDSVKARERERLEPYTVAAQYESVPASEVQDNNVNTSANTAPATNANNNSNNSNNNGNNNAMMAQNNPPAAAPSNDISNNNNNNAASTNNNSNNTPAMPSTSADWLTMVLSGGALGTAGMMIRRRRS